MPDLCHTLQSTGSCTEVGCLFSHDVTLFCRECGVWAPNYNNREAHLQGQNHAMVMQAVRVYTQPANDWCTICEARVPGGGSGWAVHIEGARHRGNVALLEASGQPNAGRCPTCQVQISPSEKVWLGHIRGSRHRLNLGPIRPKPPGTWFCTVCNRSVSKLHLAAHEAGKLHRQIARNKSIILALEQHEQNKNGVVISDEDGVDFGFVDVGQLSVQKMLFVRTSLPAIVLKSVQLSSCLNVSQSSDAFSVSLVELPHELSTESPLAITITINPSSRRGHLIDRIELTFEDVNLGMQFGVARTITSIVGVRADYELLRAAAPYVRPKKTSNFQIRMVIAGPWSPGSSTIPYTKVLLEYPLDPSVIVAGTEQQRVAAIMKLLPQDLNETTYKQHWRKLVYCEEHQMAMDLEEFDMSGVCLTQHRNIFFLEVPGLAEKRPSVLAGDSVLLQVESNPHTWYEGRVHVTREKEVGLRFHDKFIYRAGQLCNVRFTLNRVPVRRMHQALDCPFAPRRVLFPSLGDIASCLPPTHRQIQAIVAFNSLVGTNPPQLQAVASILYQKPGSVPFVVYGPPGTGKTITIVEAILQLLVKNPHSKILACAPSNAAADLIAQRLIASGRPETEPRYLFRMNAPSRISSHAPLDLRTHTFQDADGHYSVPNKEVMLGYRVIVTTCNSASIPHNIDMPAGHFSHVIVDEAGQAMEPEVMIPIKTMGGPLTNFVLSGDPKQLGPIIRSSVARTLGLGMSYLERLMNRDAYKSEGGCTPNVVKLTKNWRSHNAILKFPNDSFYESSLQECGNPSIINSLIGSPILPNPQFPVVFHGIAGKDGRESGSPSYFNIDEISAVVEYVEKLRSDRVRRVVDREIGVITPYNAQASKLRKRLRQQYESIDVGSVEIFQGQERKVIIMSTVRSDKAQVTYDLRHALGFLVNPRRMNVAITRAKAMLIIVGDPRVLGLDPLWRKFLNYIFINRGWTGIRPDWDPNAVVDVNQSDSYVDAKNQRLKDEMDGLAHRLRKIVLGSVRGPESDIDYEEEMIETSGDRPSREDNV